MWQQVYDERGNLLSNAWASFEAELRGEHAPITKIELLNDDLEPIGSSLRSACACVDSARGDITNLVSDGNIDVDVTRGTRRTAEITVLNPTAEFTPATEDFEPEGQWVGLLYINRNVRIWRGVHIGKKHLYVPAGTFMIDQCDVIAEQNMSLVNLVMSDQWKKLTKSFFGGQRVYNKDDPDENKYNIIIRDLLESAGVPTTGKFKAVLDNLSDRDAEDRKIKSKLTFSRGDSRGDRLKELARKWGLDAYFDPMGIFRTEDRTSVEDKRTVWTLQWQEIDEVGRNGGLVSLKRSFNDGNLYNHVIVIGTGNEKQTFKASRVDDNPRSKFNRDTIGDRVLLIESERLSSQAEVNRALNKAWDRRIQWAEVINAEAVCNPALEADDVIRIIDREKVKVDGRYRLQRFNVPLITSRQSLEVANIIRKEDL